MTARGDIASYGTIIEVAPSLGMKCIVMETAATFVGGTDNFTVDLKTLGGSLPVAIFGTSQTTTNAVLVAGTAAISGTSSGVCTITTSASGTNIYGIVLFFK